MESSSSSFLSASALVLGLVAYSRRSRCSPGPVVAIGTQNPGKVGSVRRAFASYSKLRGCVLRAVKVSSDVSDQPATMEETTRGAKNRALAAYRAVEGAAFGVGLESGLFKCKAFEEKLFDLCACVIYDGECWHVGYSCAWEIPDKVRQLLADHKGKNLTDGFNETGLCSDPNLGDKGGALAIVTGGRVTRPDYTVQSVQMAVAAMDPESYKCGGAVVKGINDPE